MGAVAGPADRNFWTNAAMSLKSGCGEINSQAQTGHTSPYVCVVMVRGAE